MGGNGCGRDRRTDRTGIGRVVEAWGSCATTAEATHRCTGDDGVLPVWSPSRLRLLCSWPAARDTRDRDVGMGGGRLSGRGADQSTTGAGARQGIPREVWMYCMYTTIQWKGRRPTRLEGERQPEGQRAREPSREGGWVTGAQSALPVASSSKQRVGCSVGVCVCVVCSCWSGLGWDLVAQPVARQARITYRGEGQVSCRRLDCTRCGRFSCTAASSPMSRLGGWWSRLPSPARPRRRRQDAKTTTRDQREAERSLRRRRGMRCLEGVCSMPLPGPGGKSWNRVVKQVFCCCLVMCAVCSALLVARQTRPAARWKRHSSRGPSRIAGCPLTAAAAADLALLAATRGTCLEPGTGSERALSAVISSTVTTRRRQRPPRPD